MQEFYFDLSQKLVRKMGALESKQWSEIPPETPQKEVSLEEEGESFEDPRSPSVQYHRTPILLQEYDESPQNITTKAEFRDPRSPSVKITRTPLQLAKTKQEDEDDVFEFEAKNIEGFANPAFDSSGVSTRKNSLKNTSSPGDFKRKNRLSRRESLPQKLFSDKTSTLPRSPLVQRNFSVPEDMSGKNKKFSLVHKKKGLISKDFSADKENAVEQVIL